MATERYHPLFASDLAAACSYHDSIAETIGNRFRGNVRAMIQAVVERPESFGRIGTAEPSNSRERRSERLR